MRRLICAIMCLCFLGFPAEQPQPAGYIALTFDDGPSGRITQRLLEGLEARGVQATFLLCGYRLEDYPETAQAIFNAGHEIGIHGYSHKDMSKMTVAQVIEEIEETAALLPQGCAPVFLRPPGGAVSSSVCNAAAQTELAVLNWSVDPRDWEDPGAQAVQAAVMHAVKDGDVILLHDMYNGTVDAAFAIIDRLQAQGFKFVTVSQLAAIRGTVPKPGAVYRRF